MNGWPARSAASRKPHPKHIHPGRGAFCAPAVFAAGEMRLNGSKRRGQRARYHAKLRLPWSRARTPALVGFRLRFASQKRAAGHRPRRGRCFGLPHFRFAQAWPLGQNPGARRLPPPFCFAKTRGRSLAPPGPACSLQRQAPLAVAPRSHPGARRLPPPFCSAKTRGRSSAPPGPMFWPTTLSLRSSVAPRPKPRRLTFYRGML